jgi:long-chain acyl-CoA synthetase
MQAHPVPTRSAVWCAAEPAAGAGGWSIAGLLRGLALRGRQAAIIAFGQNGVETWDGETLAERAKRLAAGLREAGIAPGMAAALCAPNSPLWIAFALAILAAGAIIVPIDDLADPEDFAAALKTSAVRLVVTTRRRFEASTAVLSALGVGAVLVDEDAPATSGAAPWRSLLREPQPVLTDVAPDAPAILTWTSGTTGSPKAFILTHRNIATNLEALRRLDVVGPQDRALLPLPLHHVYPFVVGMLTPLSAGTAVVLPAGTSGPALMRALREGEVTTLVGVPRLYEALTAAIESRIDARHRVVGVIWRALLTFAGWLQQSTGLRLGRLMFAPVCNSIAPKLRLLVSGGAPLQRDTEEQLEALGWTVLSGYGLAETASLFTGNRPGGRRAGSVGRPLADGRIRIAQPDSDGIGEIELCGSSITKGYLNNPEANSAAFTADGWFSTGDLGFVDREGFLFVTGRAKEILVLGGGRKVNPEELERLYGDAPEIAELALIEDKGTLVALVRPDQARLYARGATNLRDGIRVILGEKAQRLPSYQRLSGFALTNQPLPRTRLGKYRRFLLPTLYAQALAGSSARAAKPPSPEDQALLQHPMARAVWNELERRFPDQSFDLDTSLSLDLGLDSFGWMELAILLQDRAGVALSDQDLADIETIRDLLRLGIARGIARGAAPVGGPAPPPDIEYWLSPTGPLLTALGAALWALNAVIMCGLFRLRVAGVARLPAAGPFVLAPNHVSYLDVLAVAAALSWSRLRHTYWAGDARRFFPSRLGRIFCRAVHLFPVDAMHPGAALVTAQRVLQANDILVWFPEGWRSPDGRLQRFLPGVGELLLASRAAAVPVLIEGAFEALPRSRVAPRLHRVSVTFGSAAVVMDLRAAGAGARDEERVADGLRACVAALASRSRG